MALITEAKLLPSQFFLIFIVEKNVFYLSRTVCLVKIGGLVKKTKRCYKFYLKRRHGRENMSNVYF